MTTKTATENVNDTSARIEQWIREDTLRHERQTKTALVELRDICDRLKKTKIERIEIAFDGFGDDGSIDEPVFFDAKGNEIKLSHRSLKNLTFQVEKHEGPKRVSLSDKLEEIASKFLPFGFEINEGGYGSFNLDIKTKEFDFRYYERTTNEAGQLYDLNDLE